MATFTIGGKLIEVDRTQVEKTLKRATPGRVDRYYIETHGKRFSIKQILAETTGIPLIGFTSMDAYRVLKKLDFEVKVAEKE